jgi:hypothetical protein
MLKKVFKKDANVATNLLIGSEDAPSDREFVFNKILNVESVANINEIVNLESAEFKPNYDKIEVDLFFLRYIEETDIDEISKHVEETFDTYHKNLIATQNTLVKNELFEVRASDGLRSIKFDNETELSALEINQEKPYVVVDPMVELRKKYPAKSGRPHFYNTFTFPFWDKSDLWTNLKYGFNNKTYTYNSFLLLEIYDDNNVETQRRITTIPIYVSDRYLFNEKTKDVVTQVLDEFLNPISTETITGIQQKRPVFNLTEGVDGYSFFFLKNYIKSDFYVKFYFWDALNGKKIQFIPSSKNNVNKKWLQDVETFDQKKLYLKYELDYTTKKYTIYDYNDRTGGYDLETDHIDLYEFAYDDYWASFPVLNDQPSDLQQPTNPREYGDLLLSTNAIKTELRIADTKYETLSAGLLNDPDYVEFKKILDYTETEYAQDVPIGEIYHYEFEGSLEGYLMFKSSSLNIKPIGLLKTKVNKCVNVELDSFKRTVGSFRIENKSNISTYIIDSLVVKDLQVKSNESRIDLSKYGSLEHDVQTNYGLALYTEYCVIPKKTITETYDNYYTTFDTAWSDYKTDNSEERENDLLPTQTSYDYTPLINDPTHQINFANMIANKSYLQVDRAQVGDYTSFEIESLLKTKPSVKKEGIVLVVESLDPKINVNQEIIITVDVFIGAGALFHFGVIKELDITGNIEVNVYKEDIGVTSMEKIIIPIKVNLK